MIYLNELCISKNYTLKSDQVILHSFYCHWRDLDTKDSGLSSLTSISS